MLSELSVIEKIYEFGGLAKAALQFYLQAKVVVAMNAEDILSPVCDCKYCKEQRNWETLTSVGKFVGGFAATTALCELAILAAPVALGAVGFGAGGIRAASWAASIQSWYGNVQKASWFAKLTSVAMKGGLSPGTAQGIRAFIQMMYMGGAAAESFCKKDKNGNPIVPRTQEEFDNLINDAILKGLICCTCRKRIDPYLRYKCDSICTCSLVAQQAWKGR